MQIRRKDIFLFDVIGAFCSVLGLLVIQAYFSDYFKLKTNSVLFLALVGFCIFIHSLVGFLAYSHSKAYLKRMGYINLIYIVFIGIVIALNFSTITLWAQLYFLVEFLIIRWLIMLQLSKKER